jgi:hypothetical protein
MRAVVMQDFESAPRVADLRPGTRGCRPNVGLDLGTDQCLLCEGRWLWRLSSGFGQTYRNLFIEERLNSRKRLGALWTWRRG